MDRIHGGILRNRQGNSPERGSPSACSFPPPRGDFRRSRISEGLGIGIAALAVRLLLYG